MEIHSDNVNRLNEWAAVLFSEWMNTCEKLSILDTLNPGLGKRCWPAVFGAMELFRQKTNVYSVALFTMLKNRQTYKKKSKNYKWLMLVIYKWINKAYINKIGRKCTPVWVLEFIDINLRNISSFVVQSFQLVTSCWQSESPSRSPDPGILFPFQDKTHQQRAGGPTREDSHCLVL